jgi:uncharacterized membrane protein YkvA (DUF1232 family)
MLLDGTELNALAGIPDIEPSPFSSRFRVAETVSKSSADVPATPVYFLHIEKTAGVSVHKVLTERFEPGDICPARLDSDIAGTDARSLAPYRLYSGHFTGAFPDFLGMQLRTVTLLRDPIQRSISHYAHIRRDPGAAHHQLAQSLSLKEFCLHPLTRPLIEDYQTRFLAGAVLEDPLRRTAPADLPRSEDERALLLSRARARLAACAAVGATEHLATTLALFCEVLGLSQTVATPFENPSYNRPKDIDHATLSIIRELTRRDAVLYQEAVRMLFARAYMVGLTGERRPPANDVGPRKSVPLHVKGSLTLARCCWPETAHRIKLGLSEAIGKLPRAFRVALAFPYAAYRLLLDKSVPWARRAPLLLGLLYLAAPFDLLNAMDPVPGYPDKVAALALGFAVSAALSGRKKLQDLKFAAISRFGL